MRMTDAFLHRADAEPIPLRVGRWSGRTFVECAEPLALLRHLAPGREPPPCPVASLLRGVVIPGEGGVFELRDPFGLVDDEVLRLSEAESRDLLLDRLW